MHPVNYLFEEIYRDYWGIPRKQEEPAREHPTLPGWRRRARSERGESRR